MAVLANLLACLRSARPEPLSENLIRTRRLEVVDDKGRVRVAVGLIGQDEQTTIFGVVVRDVNGRNRAWAIDYDDGAAEFGLDWGGNTVAALSVDDSGEPSLYLAEEEPWGA